MGWLQNICTCVGCIAGLACIALTGGAATPLVTAAAIGIGGVTGNLVGRKMDQDEKKVKNQAKDLENKSQVIEALKQDNERIQQQENEKKKEYESQEQENRNLEQQIEDARKKSNDFSLSKDERKRWKAKAIELEERLNKGKDKSKSLLNQIKELQDKISDNNKNIASVGSGSSNKDKHPIMQFLTLENIIIVVAIYALWQIVIKDDRRY